MNDIIDRIKEYAYEHCSIHITSVNLFTNDGIEQNFDIYVSSLHYDGNIRPEEFKRLSYFIAKIKGVYSVYANTNKYIIEVTFNELDI